VIGKTVSHYRIIEKLGEGGMGVVYKARDTKLDRSVVLKFLPEHLTRDEGAKTRFVREAKAASALNHPNITTIYEIGEEEDQSFISMEYVEGQSIQELIKQRTLRPDEILDIAMQVCEGLSSAHEKGIVHRDIKSGNIMVTSKGQSKVMDFGLAKVSGQTTITKTDAAMGTVAYMSPEQARGEAVDHRTDIWSLGAIMYEMITGQLPFKSDYEQAVIYSILNEEPQPVNQLRPEIPESLSTIVSKTLQKDPAQRYQSAAEMLMDLRAAREGFAVPGKRKITKSRRRLILASIIVAFAITVVGLLTRHRETEIVGRIPIGVMFFDNQTGEQKYDYLRKVLADMLITDLSQSRYLQVMTFPRMFDLLRSMGHEKVDVIDGPLGFELCQLAGADVMVMGSIMRSGNTFVLNAQVLDVVTKELRTPPYRVTGAGEESILGNLVDDLTDNIKKGLEISAREIRAEKRAIGELTTTSLEAYRYYVAGLEAAFRMDNQEAIGNLEKAVFLDSAFADAHNALARQYYTIGQREKSLQVIESLKAFSGELTEEELLEILALEAYVNHDWDLAIQRYQKLVQVNPENIGAHADLGTIYYQRKMMYDEGISEFEKILELDPRGLTSYPQFAQNLLGWAYFRKDEFEKARSAFKRYVTLSPNRVYPLNVLAEFQLGTGDYDSAMINLRRSMEIDPDNAITSALLGDLYMAKGLFNQAQNNYQQYLVLSLSEAESAEAHSSIGKLHYLKGDYAAAIKECGQALKLDPGLVEAHWIQGLAFVKTRMFDRAESEISAIEELIDAGKNEDMKRYLHHLGGELLLRKDLYQEALENLNQAALIWSLERTFFINALAQAYLEIGTLDKAIEKSEVVLGINPNHAQTHYLLGLVYDKQGNKRKARKHFETFLEIWKDADQNLPQLTRAREQLKKT